MILGTAEGELRYIIAKIIDCGHFVLVGGRLEHWGIGRYENGPPRLHDYIKSSQLWNFFIE